jgi:YHS domain-containing protein
MKHLLISLSTVIATINLLASNTCPLMIGEENDPEETVTVQGKSLMFCCGSCVSKFEDNKAYYIAASKELFAQFSSSEREKLDVNKVVLLEQRRCPIYNDRIVNPNSPSVEYKVNKIYFWSSSALRRWKKDPAGYYEKARAAKILK